MLYKKETNELIENSLKTKLSELERLSSYDEMNHINFAHVKIVFAESGGRKDAILHFINTPSNPDYLKIFKTFSIGKFLIKDYRKDVRDSSGNIPYYSVKFDYDGNPVKALLREIIEDDSDLISRYSDVVVNDKHYSVLKITQDNDVWTSDDGYKIVDISHENTPGDIYLDRMFNKPTIDNVEYSENILF